MSPPGLKVGVGRRGRTMLKCVLPRPPSIRKALENRTNMEDDRITLLENQLGQARLIAEESDKKYEEMARRIALLEADLERAEERASTGER